MSMLNPFFQPVASGTTLTDSSQIMLEFRGSDYGDAFLDDVSREGRLMMIQGNVLSETGCY